MLLGFKARVTPKVVDAEKGILAAKEMSRSANVRNENVSTMRYKSQSKYLAHIFYFRELKCELKNPVNHAV